ncbi:MAG: PQQ-binding-like beta-propeller repeat protein [Acidobacteriota bacterium]|nr:PQQ-binding-like beta-propeller repeat protein [Acidobacteriota bacterium]
MKHFFATFTLLALGLTGSPLGAQDVVIFYGNGVATSPGEAEKSRHDLELKLRERFPSLSDEEFDRLVQVRTSYNQSACWNENQDGGDQGVRFCLRDFLQASRQALNAAGLAVGEATLWQYVLGVLSAPVGVQEILDQLLFVQFAAPDLLEQDLDVHRSTYSSLISGAQTSVLLVAHSQGNLFGNAVYPILEPEERSQFRMVSVASPAPDLLGDSSPIAASTTLREDPIDLVPGNLPWNVTNGLASTPKFEYHDFEHSYLARTETRAKILDDIERQLASLGIIELLSPGTLVALRSGSWDITRIDPGSGSSENWITLPSGSYSGLTFDPDRDLLYTVETGLGELVAVNTTDQSITFVGSLGLDQELLDGIGDLTFGPGNNLFALAEDSSLHTHLLRIDPTTGQASLLGAPSPEGHSSLEYDPETGRMLSSYSYPTLGNALSQFAPFSGSWVGLRPTNAPKLILLADQPGTGVLYGLAVTEGGGQPAWSLGLLDPTVGTYAPLIDGDSAPDIVGLTMARLPPSEQQAPHLAYPPVTTDLCMQTTPALGDDGSLYAAASEICIYDGSRDVGLAAFDPSTGAVLWGPSFPEGCDRYGTQPARFGYVGPSIGANGVLYAVGDWNSCLNGRLVAINSDDGSVKWDHGDCPGGGNTSPHPRQVPALDETRNAVHFGASRLCSTDMESSENLWDVDGAYFIGGKGLVIDNNGSVYMGTQTYTTNRLTAFTSTGALIWDRGAGGANFGPEIQGLANDTLILHHPSQLYSLIGWNRATGQERWRHEGFSRPIVDEAGRIYAGGVGTPEVLALTADGNEEWRVTLPEEFLPPILIDFLDSTGFVYARSGSSLLAIRTEDGALAWSFEADARLDVGAVLDADGRIVLSDSQAMLYVLDTRLDYAQSEWPIALYANRRHTAKQGDILDRP